MADFQQNFLASLHGGTDFGQRMKGIGDQSKLNQLAAQSYSTPPDQRDSLLAQMAGVDAGAAFQAEKQMAYSDERRNTNMVNMAKLLTNAPPQARAGLYRSMVPTLSRFGLSDLPQDYTPETAPIIDKAAQSLVQAYQGTNATPTDVRSFQMMTAGLSPEDQMRARRINLGLDGRASSSGFSQVKFTGADGRERIGVLNGKTGQIDLPDGTSFNPQTGAISATAGAPQGAPAAGMYDTPNGRVAIGEGLTPAQWQAVQADVANSGGSDSYQLPPQPVQRPASGGAFVGRSPEEQAALTEQAKTDVQLRNLPTELNMRTDAALREAGGKASIETGAKRQSVQAENDRSFSLYDTAMRGVSEGLGSSMTGPLAGRLPAVTAGQQIAEGGVAAIAPVLKQMFRSAGEGTFTDKDQELLLAMIPTRTDLPEARDWKIANIDRIVREKLGQPQKNSQGSPTQSQPAKGDFSNLWN